MWPKLTLVTALAGPAAALLVATDSPCEQYCGNVLTTTTGADMACGDGDFASNVAGTVFKTCIGCELKSTYASGNETDLQELLYNLRFAISYCLFGLENNTQAQDTPCATSRSCGLLEPAFDWNNLTTDAGSFDFCQSWIDDQVPKCTDCLAAGSMSFMRNYVTILDAACRQMPDIGSTLSNITTPSATPLYTYTPKPSAISLGAKVGIAVGGLVVLLSAAGFLIVCLGRRRRRTFLKSLQSRYGGQPGWPSPPPGGHAHDRFDDTPLSQKPLRGWDDNTPVSAVTMSERGEKSGLYPRYFSPYSSQYSSPVNAEDGPPYAAWPTAVAGPGVGGSALEGQAGPSFSSSPGEGGYCTQEEFERMVRMHQYQTQIQNQSQSQSQKTQIGLALGGSDPSLRDKASDVSLRIRPGAPSQPEPVFQPAPVHGSAPQPQLPLSSSSPTSLSSLSSLSVSAGALREKPIKGKVVVAAARQAPSSHESYELREIDSNGLPPGALHNPGYGRAQQHYPRPPSPKLGSAYGGLTENDARHGHAL